jgi:hypothetical protein
MSTLFEDHGWVKVQVIIGVALGQQWDWMEYDLRRD